MFVITKRLKDASIAHRLINRYSGKCKNLHGHNYEFEVEVSGRELDKYGMLIDFSQIKALCDEYIQSNWDHGVLVNEEDFDLKKYLTESGIKNFEIKDGCNSTAEWMSKHLSKIFYYRLDSPQNKLEYCKVRVWETKGSFASYRWPEEKRTGQLNPIEVLKRGIIYGKINENFESKECQVQQVGIDLKIEKDIKLRPGECKNVALVEYFNMQDTFGLLRIRSTFSRKGIFLSSGIYDPGFTGKGGMTLYNHSNEVFKAKVGTRLCQLIVFEADKASDYKGIYNNQTEVEKDNDSKDALRYTEFQIKERISC